MSKREAIERRQLIRFGAAIGIAPLVSACEALGSTAAARSDRPTVAHAARYGAITCHDFSAQAIAECLESAGPLGGEVFLPEGTYTIDRTITIPSDRLTLRGAGPGTVLQALDNSINLLFLDKRTQVEILDLTVRGVGQDGPGGIGINASEVQRCTFGNLWIERCGSADAAGLFLYGGAHNRIVNCHFEANGRGIHLYNGSIDNVIEGCTGRGNAKEMIFLTTGCADNRIANCVSEDDGSRAPAVAIAIHHSDRSTLTDCTVRRSGLEQGVEIAAGLDNVVMGCTIAESKWAGLHIVNSQRTLVSGNTITGNLQSGIVLRSAGNPEDVRPSDHCMIVGNLIANNCVQAGPGEEVPWAGVEIEQGSYTLIERNQIRDNRSAAIRVAAGSFGTRISGNTVSGAHARLLIDSGTGTVSDLVDNQPDSGG